MANHDDTIAQNYVAGAPATESAKLFTKVKDWGTWQGGSGVLSAAPGTKRFWYDDAGFLYSYRMRLAYRSQCKGKLFILVNGDGAPTMMTGQHQRELRMKLSKAQWYATRGPEPRTSEVLVAREVLIPHAFIPFSVLDQANIPPQSVEVIATTSDFEQKRTGTRKNKKTGETETYEYTVHFLGETLFRYRDSIYVCGLDRNDDPSKRMFYMAKVPGPAHTPPKSVDEALRRLRPLGLPKDTKRQGEWFFVPAPSYKPPKNAEGVVRATRVPIVSDDPKAQLDEMRRITTRHGEAEVPGWTVPGRERRHVATTMVVNEAVYAKGAVHDEEHSALRLGDTWHKVVKNLAVEGWRYVPGPMARASVA